MFEPYPFEKILMKNIETEKVVQTAKLRLSSGKDMNAYEIFEMITMKSSSTFSSADVSKYKYLVKNFYGFTWLSIKLYRCRFNF